MARELNPEELDLVQRFFDFELSEPELEQFDKKLKSDSDFKKHVEDFQEAESLINTLKKGNEKKDFFSLVNEKKKEKNNWKNLIILLCVIGVIVAIFFFWNQDANKNEEKIYADVDSYVTKMTKNIMRGDSDTTTKPLSETQSIIKEMTQVVEHEDSLKLLLNRTQDIDAQEVIYWNLVKYYFKNKNIKEAKKILQKIIQQGEFNSSKKAKQIFNNL